MPQPVACSSTPPTTTPVADRPPGGAAATQRPADEGEEHRAKAVERREGPPDQPHTALREAVDRVGVELLDDKAQEAGDQEDAHDMKPVEVHGGEVALARERLGLPHVAALPSREARAIGVGPADKAALAPPLLALLDEGADLGSLPALHQAVVEEALVDETSQLRSLVQPAHERACEQDDAPDGDIDEQEREDGCEHGFTSVALTCPPVSDLRRLRATARTG